MRFAAGVIVGVLAVIGAAVIVGVHAMAQDHDC